MFSFFPKLNHQSTTISFNNTSKKSFQTVLSRFIISPATVALSLIFLLCWCNGWGQTSITNTSTITESFSGYSGTSTLPTNWATTGGGTNGNTFQGTNQTGGTSGGWYGNNNMSYLGSGSANNGRATWKLQNNSGSTLTGFNLSFTARMWRSNTSASPTVRVYYIVSSSSTFPTNNETGWTELTSLSFSDATTNISTGATMTQNNVSASVSNGNYIYLRWIHSGGGNSDNLGWDEINFSANMPAATPTISSSGTLSALSTTYGTASSNTSFSVSGANMTAGISINPPAGFQVSTTSDFSSNLGSNGSPITVGAAGTIASTTVYVRLAATTAPGTYSGNIVLSSSGATNVNVATVSSTVNTKALTISGISGANKIYDATTTASSTGTAALVGIVGGDAVSISGSPSLTFDNANVGTGKTISVSGYTLSGAQAARYTLTQPSLTADITTKALTITADNVTKTAGALLTGGPGSTAFSSSGLVGGQTIGTVTIAYGSAGATTGDGATPGVYTNQVTPSAATGGTFTSSNYSISYVAGNITVEAAPASPTISVSGTLSALSTTYGTPSSTASFTVSGAAMTTGITITPPTAFEVATTSDFSTTIGTNSSPLVIGSAGTIANTTIYVRLRAVSTVAGSPYSGNITLTSTGAATETIATTSSTVSTKTLTISGLSASNKTYNALLNVSVSGTPTYTGLANGESFSVSGSPTWAFATKTVGTAKTINQTGTYSAPSTNYTVTQPTLTADITAKSLTVSGASAQNKTYDGSTAATISGASLVGVESGDAVSVSGGGTFADANAANGISVSANLSLSGTDAGNYSLTQPTGLTANITKANQTITFGALADKATTDTPFSLTATASSGLTVSYTSSNTAVATISGSTLTIVGPGSTTITASQAGNTNYNAATYVAQTQVVVLSGYYWNGGSISANPANGGTGTWGTTNTWRQPTATGSQATWSNSNTAVFEGTAGIVSIGADYTCTAMNVNTTNYTWTPNGTTARTLNGNVILADNVNLNFNDLSQTSNRTISIGGNISGGTNSKITLLVNQTGTNTSRLNLASTGATLSVPLEISVGSTSSNYGNFAIVGTALNTVLSSTFSLTNNTNYFTTIGATSGNSITVNGLISGSSGLMFAAGSSGGAGIINLNGSFDYTGLTRFRFSNTGVVRALKANVFPSNTELDLGNGGNLGTFDLNGFNQEVAGLSSTSTSATRGIVNTGDAATLTLSGDGNYILNSFTGIGIPSNTSNLTNPNNNISIIKTGSGSQEFQSALNYTGLTTISGGTLRLNRSAGTTIPVGNNVLVNGGILQISKDQTLNNVTVSSGTLRVDSGVTLTINGTFTGGGTIENNGTIVLVGPSTFPGSSSSVSAMNNLTINRAGGVSLDKSIEVTGTLTLTSGTLSVGTNTLTLSGAYPSSNINNILTTASSSLVFNCTGTGPFTLPNFTALGGLTVNSSGQTYNLNSSPTISGNLILTNGTLEIGTRTLTYSGSSISRTSGVIDASNASATMNFTNVLEMSLPNGLFAGSKISNLSSNGVGLSLAENLQISSVLTMMAGNITTSGNLEIGSNATNLGSINWTSGTVIGPLKRWFGTSANANQASGIFPVGTADRNRYAIINFTENTDGGYIVMEYKTGKPTMLDNEGNPLADPYNLPLTYTSNSQNNYIQNVDGTGYWDITPYNSSNEAYTALDNNLFNITLRINNSQIESNPVTANPPGMRIIRAKGNPSAAHDPFEIGAVYAEVLPYPGSEMGTDYLVKSNNLQGFSYFNIGGDNSTPLPVELLFFNGECTASGNHLRWATASEHNSSHFDLEASYDGENWNLVNRVNAAGFSNEKLDYQAVDRTKSQGTIYYRLRQVDINGTEKLYNSIALSCTESDKFMTTYPNPSGESFSLTINDETLVGDGILTLCDINGRLLFSNKIDILNGTNSYEINTKLPSGYYFLQLETVTGKSSVIRHSIR